MREKSDGEKERWRGERFWWDQLAILGVFLCSGFHCGCHRRVRNLPKLSTDRLDVTKGGLKHGPRGTRAADELLHEALKRSDTRFPGKTSISGTAEGVSTVEGEMGEGSCCI